MNLPQDIGNQVLDAIGSDMELGDLQDGSREGKVILRAYSQTLRQLHRAVNWSFARMSTSLVLLADASGNTANVGTIVCDSRFIYEYAYPTDCMKVRFIPWAGAGANSPIPQGNIGIPATPLYTGLAAIPAGQRMRPAKFQVCTDPNYPVPPGSNYEVQGISPSNRTVICTDVPNAQCVYTALQVYPSLWDPLFRRAFVSALAAEVAFPLNKDKKLGLAVRQQQTGILKQALIEARMADGNESTSTSDIAVDWMQTRFVGGSWGSQNGGRGAGGNGWGDGGYDGMLLADGSVF